MTDPTPRATIDVLRLAADARGLIFEPLGAEGLPAQRNVHVVITAPGAGRANHYHERGTEVLVVLGPALVRLREGSAWRDVRVPPGEAWRFLIPPFVGHAIQATGDAPLLTVGFNTVEHDPAAPDVVRDALIEP